MGQRAAVDIFRCRCVLNCKQRATQEDLLCDNCRVPNHVHVLMHDGAGWVEIGFSAWREPV